MIGTDAESYWEGQSPRERFLFDLLHTGGAAALGGDEKRATSLIEKAWKSAYRLHPVGGQELLQQVTNDQLKRLLNDADQLNFWQAHDWYTGERTAGGEWRFFHAEDAEGQSCTGASLRETLDELRKVQPDLRGAMDDADAWEG
ncbi:hypothetical protein [Pseudomonas protegens]|uniref:hypothetical protein n=1 Tax=Pseudomonas protegens TaxID=380021 RepID=UPI001B31AA43|nr:hypothetical protein [Pseudomonas protegens]MBP5107432.1 hypothetical protein [Pseudomonas protegens]MBP5133493.1 hypothetical protein [Pseudomonas protegens]MBP5133674.1 hypothetical protein [Pseudomonas protegens]MBP5150676.1 hypothetical protein [Pseudomonas protegens]MBP5151077.1 hypothetical protein [Pseudomonas protegens]